MADHWRSVSRPMPALEAIDAEWLTEALRGRGLVAEARVVRHALGLVGRFSNELWRIRLEYDRVEPRAPVALIAKRPRPDHPQRAGQSFAAESRFYRELAPVTPARFATCVAGSMADDPVQLIVLEDVAPRRFAWTPGAVDGHGELAVDAMARMHARWLGHTDELGWLPVLGAEARAGDGDASFERSWEEGQAAVRALTSDGFCALIERLRGHVEVTLAPLQQSPTLLHGDAHGENIPLIAEGSDVVFLDWPGARRGLAACDLAAFVIMSYPAETRRRVERELVERHAAAMTAAGAAPRDDPWLDYRRAAFARVVDLVAFTPRWPTEPEAQRGLRMVVERIATAALELDLATLVV